jgi:hypothetical protein
VQSSFGQPPKQRWIPFESGLQTAFLPSQQFCEALTAPEPPQMLPGGLHACPPVQRKSSFVLVSFCGAAGCRPVVSQNTPYGSESEWSASGDPPQQAWVRSQ